MSAVTGFLPPSLRRGLGALLLAVSLGVLAGCSGGAHAATANAVAPAATQIDVTETEFSITMPATLAAGSYTFAVRNTGAALHDLVVSQNGRDVAASATIPPGGSASLSATLRRGTYVFYCNIDGHRAQGMQRTVQVS
ncbi:MAG: Copper binding protein plastocyanin/azurin family [Modestobacter sp.]|nr:Copper binding protein plastocyanin/azurin family [Modestobacter sp.]